MKITECKGMRIHAAALKGKITWRVNYKNEGVWCNTVEELLKVINQVTMVQLYGENHKTWQVGKDGWQKNSD